MSRAQRVPPLINVFPTRTRPALDPGDPFNVRPLQAKLPGSRPFRAERDLDRLPVPFIKFPAHLVGSPEFSPDVPPQGFFLVNQIPTVKLRGLGPMDSIILRTAITEGLLDPAHIMLSPLIPWVAQTVPTRKLVNPFATDPDAPTIEERVVHGRFDDDPPGDSAGDPGAGDPGPVPADCPDAPMQPDGMYDEPNEPLTILEVKPNAGYVAFGQSLAYAWNWNRFYGPDWPAVPAIVTDLPRAYLPGMCLDFGVTLFTLGRLVVEPPPYPT